MAKRSKAGQTLDRLEDLMALLEARPQNPPIPTDGDRDTYFITFDWGSGNTEGMLDGLRGAGFHAVTNPRLPRTSIICRVRKDVEKKAILNTISKNLLDMGSAVVAKVGDDRFHIWPDKPWKDDQKKRWGAIKE